MNIDLIPFLYQLIPANMVVLSFKVPEATHVYVARLTKESTVKVITWTSLTLEIWLDCCFQAFVYPYSKTNQKP